MGIFSGTFLLLGRNVPGSCWRTCLLFYRRRRETVALCLFDLEDDRPERLWRLAVLKDRGLLLERLPGQETYRLVGFFRYSGPEWIWLALRQEITVV